MSTHYEVSLQQALDGIRDKVAEMGGLCQQAVRDAVRALREGNRQLAYSVILRDQRIDELEKEVDRLCLEFLVRQQPAGAPLRLAYATIRINLELERVGDYAESIARQVIKLANQEVPVPSERLAELAERAMQTLHDAVESYAKQDLALADEVMRLEEVVDALKSRVNAELVQLYRNQGIPLEVLHPLMTVVRRLERVADQARSISLEVLYACTGEDTKHRGADVYRLLFVDEHNACRSLMAAALANALQQPGFIFDSAGLDPHPADPFMIQFMRDKGLDVSRVPSKPINQVSRLDEQDVIIALAPAVKRFFPQVPRKVVFLEWCLPDPSAAHGAPEAVRAAYEQTFRVLQEHVRELVNAIVGNNSP